MSEYGHYVTYRNATDQIQERVEQRRRMLPPGRGRRHAGRKALARGLHSLADRLDD